MPNKRKCESRLKQSNKRTENELLLYSSVDLMQKYVYSSDFIRWSNQYFQFLQRLVRIDKKEQGD